MSTLKYAFAIGSAVTFLTACQPEVEDQSSTTRYLYVSTGICNTGTGITTYTAATASNVILRLNSETGQYEGRVADFSTVADAPATPVSIADYDDEHLLALIDHGTLRRIEKIEKKLAGTRSTLYNNTSATAPIGALTSALKSLLKLPDGSLLVSRTTAIEKLNTSLARVPGNGTTAWVASPGGVCATATVNFNSLTTYPTTGNASGYNIVYTHSANASNATTNRIGVISGATGWNGTAGCVSNQSTVAAAAPPVATVYMKNYQRLVVAYAGTNTTPQNSLYTYAIDEAATSNVISDATKSFEDASVVFAPSAMYYDESKSTLYVAGSSAIATNITTGNTAYKIEKFTYDPTTKLFTRAGSMPFYAGNIETRCISSMFVGN